MNNNLLEFLKSHPTYPKKRKFTPFEAMLDLILEANPNLYKPFIRQGVEIGRGQKDFTFRELAKKWNWGMKKLCKFILTLSDSFFITLKTECDFSVYTIVNFDFFSPIIKEKENAKGNASLGFLLLKPLGEENAKENAKEKKNKKTKEEEESIKEEEERKNNKKKRKFAREEKTKLHEQIENLCSSLSITFLSSCRAFSVYENRYSAADVRCKAEDACVWINDQSLAGKRIKPILRISRLALFLKDCKPKAPEIKYKTSEEMEAEFNRRTK